MIDEVGNSHSLLDQGSIKTWVSASVGLFVALALCQVIPKLTRQLILKIRIVIGNTFRMQ